MQESMSGDIEEKYAFDTFVSYHETDKEWVTESLIKLLEDEGIAVCWDDRDFELGKTVIENKLNALCSSASTIAVISPEYSEDEELWLHLRKISGLTNEKIVEKFLIIPVVFRDGQIPDLFKPIWKLDWTNQTARKFFWSKLVQSIKKQRNSKFSM